MQQSRVIEVEGVFVAAAVALPNAEGWRIVAADARVGRLHGVVAGSLQDVRRLARLAYQASRPVPAAAGPGFHPIGAKLGPWPMKTML